jgi:ATP-dependent Clp protease protease subunit
MKTIQIIDSITDEKYKEFSLELREFEKTPKTPVYVELCSPGGDAYAALAYASRIRLSPCDIIITGYGLIASAATIILAYGDKRRMTKESWVMVHEDSGRVKGGTTLLEVEVAHMRRLEYQWIDLFEHVTKTRSDEWEKLHKKTTYLSAKECLTLGLIDEVI